jgi:UDP-2,3-diacylglucosamine pyrophosphatase LpxH
MTPQSTPPPAAALPRIAPCPVQLTLELGPDGRLAFVSDTHLSGGGPTSDFAAASELAELFACLHDHPGQVILVLGGDILDLLQAQRPGQEALDRAMDRALGGPDADALGRALRELGARPGVTIAYLVGNHDAALAWDASARQRLVREFGVHHVALRVHVQVRAAQDGRGDVWLLAEHGDALDPHNRRTDPFDPLDSPTGEHIVTEVINRLDAAAARHPRLGLDQADNVRPATLVPTWLVANFFYRFLSQALRRFALPLTVLFVLLHLPLAALVLSDLSGRFAEAGELGASAIRWALGIVAVDLVLLVGLSAFLGRSLQRAVPVYGGRPVGDPDPEARAASMTALLDCHAPNAQILLTGHAHQACLTPTPDGRVLVDAGCWVRALVPTRSRLGLPPVFAPTYPCTWAEVRPAPAGATVTLWRRRLAVDRRLTMIERLVTAGRLPPTVATPPQIAATATPPALLRSRTPNA